MSNSSSESPLAILHAASEEELACRAQDGCADSFNELAARLQPRLLYVIGRRTRHHADAEDIVQKTFLRAFEKIHLYDPTRQFSPWLFTIAMRLAAEHHRRPEVPTVSGEQASALVDPGPTPAQLAIRREDACDIWKLAEQVLTPDQWTALWLLYGEQQSVRDIASVLKRTSVSVRVLLYRARKSLAPHLSAFAAIADSAEDEFVTFPVPQIARAESS